MDEKLKEEIEALVKEDLSKCSVDSKKHRKPKPVRIRYNGQWLILRSGKTIWKRIGDAKNALLCHRESVCYYDHTYTHDPSVPATTFYKLRKSNLPVDSKDYNACRDYYTQVLFDSVEFVEVDDLF